MKKLILDLVERMVTVKTMYSSIVKLLFVFGGFIGMTKTSEKISVDVDLNFITIILFMFFTIIFVYGLLSLIKQVKEWIRKKQ